MSESLFPEDQLRLWYRQSRRDFPWRRDPQPYQVWICEVMSQQSTMQMMLPIYARWMKEFPRLKDLASAPEEAVVRAWAGLGYYSRARNVRKAAQILQSKLEREPNCDGAWPRTAEEWAELPGVGPYTSKAIAAIAFGEKTLPVDGNVIRVLSRVFLIPDPLNNKKDRALIEDRAKSLATAQRADRADAASEYAQAFMELGATVCKPQNPQCELCPLHEACGAYALATKSGNRVSVMETYPQKKTRRALEPHTLLKLLYRNARGDFLLRRIPVGRRLQGQWEFPNLELSGELSPHSLGSLQKNFELLGPFRHTITHHNYSVFGILAGRWDAELPQGHEWLSVNSPDAGEFSRLTTSSRKLLKFLVD